MALVLRWFYWSRKHGMPAPHLSKEPNTIKGGVDQTSKLGKVQVAYEGESGTRSVNLCSSRWRLHGNADEEGVSYSLHKMSL